MKKLLLMCLFVVAYASTHAQTIIPKAGLTLSKFDASEEEGDIKSRIGFTLGVGFNIPVGEIFSVQPELNFIQKGSKAEWSESGSEMGMSYSASGKANVGISYLEIPVLFKASFGDETKFFLNAGPSLGVGLGGKAKNDISYSIPSMGVNDAVSFDGKVKFGKEPDNYEGDDTYFDNRIDFGLQIGGGVLIGNKVMIDIRYGLGLSSLYDKPDGASGDDWKVKNRVLQFTLGIPLNLK